MAWIEFEGYDKVLYTLTSIYDLKGIENGMGKGCALVERKAKRRPLKIQEHCAVLLQAK